MLFTNPLFVRGHDFRGLQTSVLTWRTTELFGIGWPSNGGGRLVGSLAGLPYALASAEQNFLAPSQTQALIWGDLAPQTAPQRHGPTLVDGDARQLHWVGLHERTAASYWRKPPWTPAGRAQVMEALAPLVPPGRADQIEQLLVEGDVQPAVELVTPRSFSSWRATPAPHKPRTIPHCWRKFAAWPRLRLKR